jgi:hypothetical protein
MEHTAAPDTNLRVWEIERRFAGSPCIIGIPVIHSIPALPHTSGSGTVQNFCWQKYT